MKTRFWLGVKEAREDSCPKVMSVSPKELQLGAFFVDLGKRFWVDEVKVSTTERRWLSAHSPLADHGVPDIGIFPRTASCQIRSAVQRGSWCLGTYGPFRMPGTMCMGGIRL